MESSNGQRILVNNMHIYTLYALWYLWTQVHCLGCCLFRVFTNVSCYFWQFSRALVCKNFLASLLGYYKPLVTFFGCVRTGLEDYWSLLTSLYQNVEAGSVLIKMLVEENLCSALLDFVLPSSHIGLGVLWFLPLRHLKTLSNASR